MNSGLVVTGMFARVEGHEIHLTIAINSALWSKKTSQCTFVHLGAMKPGEYSVAYGDSLSLQGKPDAVVHHIGTAKFD